MAISRDLYLEHGWKMPEGIARAGARNPTNFFLAEWQAAKRSGIDPRELKAIAQSCWKGSDNANALHAAFKSYALQIAQGDRRGYVVLDYTGEVHSLSRLLGVKQKDLAPRLSGGPSIPTLAEARQSLAGMMSPAIRAHIAEAKSLFAKRSEKLGSYKSEMTKLHRDERAKLDARHKAEWDAQTRTRAARLPRGLKGLWHRFTGQYQKVRALNEEEARLSQAAQARERDALIARQLDQRSVLQGKIKELRAQQAALLLNLRRDLARFSEFSKQADRGLSLDESPGLALRR